MGINKQKPQAQKTLKPGISDNILYLLFIIIPVAVTIGLNGITVRNYYNLDDYHIAKNNPDFEQRIKAIPRILTTLYSSGKTRISAICSVMSRNDNKVLSFEF